MDEKGAEGAFPCSAQVKETSELRQEKRLDNQKSSLKQGPGQVHH